jgi:hypothetical protein
MAMGTLLHKLPHLTAQPLQLVEHSHHFTEGWSMF